MNTQERGSPNPKIKEVSFGEISHLKSIAKKERVPLENTRNTRYYAFIENGIIKGITAVFRVSKLEMRFKSTFVLPQYRFNGISKLLNDFTFELFLASSHTIVTAFCTPINLKWYIRKGFNVVYYKGTITNVKYEKL